jgi:hypothetical protein
MIRPTINPNGSSIDYLIWTRREALDHLRDAVAALRRVAPHGRDYPSGVDAWHHDCDLQFARIEHLNMLRKEILMEAMAIKEQGE